MNKDKPRKIALKGQALIREPLLNKGSAFTQAERQAFDLEGLLPYQTQTIEQQAERVYKTLCRYEEPLEKYVALAAVQDRNEHLYFYLLEKHLEELLPIVYTPTVSLATKYFSHVFQRGRGVWVTPKHKGSIAKTLRLAARDRTIRLIVVTDNESILGIGDQGVGGMAISIGKLALYTAVAGIDPATVLPVSLDVGTENSDLLNDPLYLGWPEQRIRNGEYEGLLDEFVTAVQSEFPDALVQWEDFRKDNALRVMDLYRQALPSFNDDIQGTGAVALAGMLSAARIHHRPLAEERVLIVGAGAAGLGIARQIRAALEAEGLSDSGLKRAVASMDSRGLIIDDGNLRDSYKHELAWSVDLAGEYGIDLANRSLEQVQARFHPTVLIGTSGQKGAFTEPVIRAMAADVDRPVILPLSNPTELSEAQPADIYQWTNGQALVAAGSPFADVDFDGSRRRIGQGNNAFIFPGIGLGALHTQLATISDTIFYASAKALAAAVTDEELAAGLLYPPVDRLGETAVAVAKAVIHQAVKEKLIPPRDEDNIDASLADERWEPSYRPYRYES